MLDPFRWRDIILIGCRDAACATVRRYIKDARTKIDPSRQSTGMLSIPARGIDQRKGLGPLRAEPSLGSDFVALMNRVEIGLKPCDQAPRVSGTIRNSFLMNSGMAIHGAPGVTWPTPLTQRRRMHTPLASRSRRHSNDP